MDLSNGYEKIAERFIKHRQQDVNEIGASAVREWAKSLAPNSAVLDLGCGSGIPISKVLVEAGMKVYGIDASPAMVKRFRGNFPDVLIACEAVENSDFFDQKFGAIVAWGLIFLLKKDIQESLIQKVSEALRSGGRFLFTSPYQKTQWEDIMTGRTSRSLGAESYRNIISTSGLSLIEEFEDQAGNYYFSSVKFK